MPVPGFIVFIVCICSSKLPAIIQVTRLEAKGAKEYPNPASPQGEILDGPQIDVNPLGIDEEGPDKTQDRANQVALPLHRSMPHTIPYNIGIMPVPIADLAPPSPAGPLVDAAKKSGWSIALAATRVARAPCIPG